MGRDDVSPLGESAPKKHWGISQTPARSTVLLLVSGDVREKLKRVMRQKDVHTGKTVTHFTVERSRHGRTVKEISTGEIGAHKKDVHQA